MHNALVVARLHTSPLCQQSCNNHATLSLPELYTERFAGGARGIWHKNMQHTIYTDHLCSMNALRRRAKSLGADELKVSTRAAKKYMVRYRGRWIHFGARNYSDFTQHRDPRRRENYRARHRAILLADGRPAYKVPSQPAYWAWKILW